MKKITFFSLIAALAALLSFATPATAGILNLTSGPTFTPDSAFTNNTIKANTIVVGGLIDLVGGATVTPDDSNTAMIAITGDYSADAGDIFSVAYSFTVDLNTASPVTYVLSGNVTVLGLPVEFSTDGTLLPGLHRYEGTIEVPVSFPLPTTGTFAGMLEFDFGPGLAPLNAVLGTLDLNIQQIDFQLDPTAATLQLPSQPLNISTRLNVGTDDNVLIGGFIVTGTDPALVVLRALGPSLAVPGVLADPTLELHDSTGATIATNDNWMENSAADQMVLTDNNLAPTDNSESALVQTLSPGGYTAIVQGVNATTGVALVEAYDLNDASTDSKLANISTRGFVETGDNVMIGGFILGGGGGGFASVIVRGLGPSLAKADPPVADVLADPYLELHNSDGDLFDSNDNWMDDLNMQTIIDQGLAPDDPSESALYEILPAGAYTAILSGVGGTSGVGLVETYDVDDSMMLNR